MSWPVGTRVRCVDGGGPFVPLTAGENYTVRVWTDAPVPGVVVAEVPGRYYAHRFKPVVRVKMGRCVVGKPFELMDVLGNPLPINWQAFH